MDDVVVTVLYEAEAKRNLPPDLIHQKWSVCRFSAAGNMQRFQGKNGHSSFAIPQKKHKCGIWKINE